MPKIVNPVTFCEHYDIDEDKFRELGILNPFLTFDTKLFIDILLLAESAHPEMNQAVTTYKAHFSKLIKLLAASKSEGDLAWRSAEKLFQFHEIEGTCLGYGASSVSGSGMGRHYIGSTLRTAKEAVDLGVTDPDLFLLIAVFEAGLGADRLSDMTTNIILDDILAFNRRMLPEIGVPAKVFTIEGNDVFLPVNPFARKKTPVILVPTDILRDLPIAFDPSDIDQVCSANSSLRNVINEYVMGIWKATEAKEREKLKRLALKDKTTIEDLLKFIRCKQKTPYDFQRDPKGELGWRNCLQIASDEPLQIDKDSDGEDIVSEIIKQFDFLVTERGLWTEFWVNREKARPESTAQKLFFAVAYSYCKANNLDCTPEAETGNGPVDFKFSKGFTRRIVVEVKLSTNSNMQHGYEVQTQVYRSAEETLKARFLIINLHNDQQLFDRRLKKIEDIRNSLLRDSKPAPEIDVIDATPKESASKRS